MKGKWSSFYYQRNRIDKENKQIRSIFLSNIIWNNCSLRTWLWWYWRNWLQKKNRKRYILKQIFPRNADIKFQNSRETKLEHTSAAKYKFTCPRFNHLRVMKDAIQPVGSFGIIWQETFVSVHILRNHFFPDY